MVFVFDFGLGERGAAGDAPINRLFAAVNEILLHDIRKQPQLVGLVFLIQGEVRVVPITQHAKALELFALDFNVFASRGFARRANGDGIG